MRMCNKQKKKKKKKKKKRNDKEYVQVVSFIEVYQKNYIITVLENESNI